MKLEYTLKNNEFNNVKEVLKAKFQISDRLISRLKKHQQIFLNGKSCYVTAKINNNDTICVDLNFNEETDNIVSTQMNLDILFEDDTLLIINKPAGTSVHPSQSHYKNSLSNRSKILFQWHKSQKENSTCK